MPKNKTPKTWSRKKAILFAVATLVIGIFIGHWTGGGNTPSNSGTQYSAQQPTTGSGATPSTTSTTGSTLTKQQQVCKTQADAAASQGVKIASDIYVTCETASVDYCKDAVDAAAKSFKDPASWPYQQLQAELKVRATAAGVPVPTFTDDDADALKGAVLGSCKVSGWGGQLLIGA